MFSSFKCENDSIFLGKGGVPQGNNGLSGNSADIDSLSSRLAFTDGDLGPL